MTALFTAVFIASLLGSTHCAGMCGAFVAFAVQNHGSAPVSKAALNAAYNAGRLMTYMMLGAAAGAMGAALNLGGEMIGMQRGAAIFAGALMVAFGATAVARASGMKVPRLPVPLVLQNAIAAGHRFAFDLPPISRAAIVGLLTTLLPCGWLYAFAITAAGTASPLVGAIVMATFWLGTLPALIAIGVSVQALSGALRSRLPVLTSLLIVIVGLYTIAERWSLPAITLTSPSSPGDLHHAAARVESLNAAQMPCCHEP